MTNSYMKKCSISLIIKEIQIKAIMSYHFIPVRIVIIKRRNINIGNSMEKKEPLYTIVGNVNLYSHYGKQHGGLQKGKNQTIISFINHF